MNYLLFLRENWRFVGFGFTASFASSFGQTFYIALSGADIRSAFELSHGGFGSWFAVATIASAVTLVWVGRLIDRFDLRWYTSAASCLLVAAMLAIAAAPNVWVLAFGLYLARLSGQGLMTHISVTSMGRYFGRDRGKAVSIATMGQSTGEALLPIIVVAAIAAMGWRDVWFAGAAMAAVTLALLFPWLLRGQVERHNAYLERIGGTAGHVHHSQRQWTRTEVLGDPRFYVVAASLLAFSFIGTGLLFHQVHIAAVKEWALELLASAFVLFALAKVATSLVVGPLIDRIGAVRLIPAMLAPLAATLLVLASFDARVVPFAYLGLLGMSVGVLIPVMGALWPELYGVVHLGAIRAMMVAFTALTSALSPAVFGWALDAGVSIETISLYCLAYVVICSAVVVWTFRGYSRGGDRPNA